MLVLDQWRGVSNVEMMMMMVVVDGEVVVVGG